MVPEQRLDKLQNPNKKTEIAEIGKEIINQYSNQKEQVNQSLESVYMEMEDEFKAAGINSPAQFAKYLGKDFEQTFLTSKKPHLSLPEKQKNTPSGEEYMESLGNLKGSARDKKIVEDLEAGRIDVAPENYHFTQFERKGTDGTVIKFYGMNGPLRIGKENPVPVQASPQLAASMRKYGVAMPTKAMVDTMYMRAANEQHVRKMVTLPAGEEMHGNRYSLIKAQQVETKYRGLTEKDFRIGTGKTKVIEQGLGHEEYGGAKTEAIPSNLDRMNKHQKERYFWQVNPAHTGPTGPGYSDYSGEFQGVYEYVTIQEANGEIKQISYEEALKHPKYGAILTGNTSFDAAKTYAYIDRHSSVFNT
ncbi:hypothetical protein GF376_02710 [Candidatus Peregrinibacteria bacterium]|nr:hypothetical protein [Candidatus Peregrinibacteria bacterium]